VDGSPVLHLARSPGRIAMATAADPRRAAEVVLAGEAETVRAATVACDEGGAEGVFLFPLAHTATLRIAIVLDDGERAIEPAELPSAQQVASGWAAHSRGGARIEVPDRRLREAIAASARFLLLASEHLDVALALEVMGFPDEAHRASLGRSSSDGAGAALAQLSAHWRFSREQPEGDEVWIAALIHSWSQGDRRADRALGHDALPGIADLLEARGEHRAAEDVRAIHRADDVSPTQPADLSARLASASATWTWATERSGHDPAMNAALILAVRDCLVAERDEELALSPVVPDAWLGQGWEVHDLPTGFGRLSYAIRWHGERPALLWELEPHDGIGPVRLTTPALDPAWSTPELKGEALLAPVPVPERPRERRGLTIPVTIEPMRRRP